MIYIIYLYKASFILFLLTLYSFILIVLKNAKPTKKAVILTVELLLCFAMIAYVMEINICEIICAPRYANIVIFIVFLIIITITSFSEKIKSNRRILDNLMVAGSMINIFICFYDVNYEQGGFNLLNDKTTPFLTLQQTEKNDIAWDDVYVYASINVRKNIFINKSVISDEMMPYLTDDEWREHDIIDIHTEYYDLSSKYFFPHLLLSELMKSKTQPESEIIEYKDDFFDECFYYYFFFRR